MRSPRYSSVVLFGGAGFIGSHLAAHLIDEGIASRVVVADIRRPLAPRRGITYVDADVRRDLRAGLSGETPDLIVNLAAIHREPGHDPHEYFETNVVGAENVTAYATAVGCNTIVFTSSISVYGPSETPKDERSLPTPTSPYGASKLAAELIHRGWQQADARRRLVIVRPGVVYGPGEGGNVTRLVKAVVGGYFVFLGNHHIRKAGGYVKELVHTLDWALDLVLSDQCPHLLYNFTSQPTPTLDEFVEAIATAAGTTSPRWSVPLLPVLIGSHIAEAASQLIGVAQPLHPVRVRKLVRSNYITSSVLQKYRYEPKYDINTALSDWKRACPQDWEVTR